MADFDAARFQVSPSDRAQLDALHAAFANDVDTHLGYPANTLYDYSELYRFFAFTINNVGDPFAEGLYKINTHAFEREVVSFFAELFHAPRDEYWGYITNGGTEANIYAIDLAREAQPDGVVYYSEDAHYSIPKALRLCNIPAVAIAADENGEMMYAELESEILEARDKPPIIVATIGTTMRGAVDQVEKIVEILERNEIKQFYIHCDAALGGMILPFMEDAPLFDFRLPIASISVSGHKMIGSPIPCGIVIARKEYVERISRHIEVIGAPDTTLAGSRNGHSALFMWYAMRRFGTQGFKQMVASCLEVKRYTLEQLESIKWPAQAEQCSLTIVIERPPEELLRKWQLAVQGDIGHLVIMPNITKAQIDAFIDDLRRA